ncbi:MULTISPECIES: DUF4376 domain-containing protein [Halomonas]|uniref:DUF4376 domain-containing protein n=1 Tax=Halomonas TaxID=2745 RepID=UPI000ED61ED3|nr:MULTISPECIES: DUF4376 domain-containing protein [Halomonas]HCR99164.1 hypothetical protein [Halomonas sp.]
MSWLNDAEVKTADDLSREDKDKLISRIESQRKEQEAFGVVINGIRYSGDPCNRAALLEVVQFAREAQQTTFAAWKDSDGQFHANHPLSEVEQALHAIAQRRGALIALEGEYQAQVVRGEIGDINSLN